MIIYKDILLKLKAAGYTTYRIEREKLIGQATVTKLRNGDPVNLTTIDTICRLLNCQPGDILEYVPSDIQRRPGNT